MVSSEPTDIVWLQTGFLGDIVLTSAACKLAMKAFPHARHHMITTELGERCFTDFGFHQVVVFRKKSGVLNSFYRTKKELFSGLQNPGKAILLQPHRSFRSSFLALYLGLETTTYRQTNFNFFATRKVERVAVFHEAARIGLLLEPYGVSREQILSSRPELADNADLSSDIIRELNNGENLLIGVACGSVWATKRWPIEKYTELTQQILLSYPSARILLLGTQAERPLAENLKKSINSDKVVNLAGLTSLDDLRSIYPKLSLLVSNDSSPVHYASAFNIPTVAIFGATVPEMGFGPLADRSRVAEIEVSCRPCSDHGPKVCPLGHFKCMNELSVEKVYSQVSEVLS